MSAGSILLARQPILDVVGRVAAYEVCYEGPAIDEDDARSIATARVLIEALATIGLERLVEGQPFFVRFSPALLEAGIASILPRGRAVIELEATASLSPAALAELDRLRSGGIALAAVVATEAPANPALLDRSEYLILDAGSARAGLEALAAPFAARRLRRLARHVATHERFTEAEAAGFDYFQGPYFVQPEPVATKRAMPNLFAILDLLVAVHRDETEPDRLAELIGHDAALAHQLLRLANSPYYGRRRLVSSLVEVVIQLGRDTVRHWVSVLLLTRLANTKPPELLSIALVRAQMCRGLADRARVDRLGAAFMVGLLSVLDALLDRPMQRVVAELPLGEDLRLALVGDPASTLGSILGSVLAYEQGQWSGARALPGLDDEALAASYVEAIDLARRLRRTPQPIAMPDDTDDTGGQLASGT
ncbi:MAG: HDOD domain-containing protein [Proteobacteria bacterium]|nr:HDOD domain-containing protein [Pseudomonadota bacterium]